MRFQVPQFIETEENIVGPFTLKQFIFVAIGGSLLFLVFIVFPPQWFIFFAIPIAIISLTLAYAKINEVPIALYLSYFLLYLINPKRYIYKSEEEEK